MIKPTPEEVTAAFRRAVEERASRQNVSPQDVEKNLAGAGRETLGDLTNRALRVAKSPVWKAVGEGDLEGAARLFSQIRRRIVPKRHEVVQRKKKAEVSRRLRPEEHRIKQAQPAPEPLQYGVKTHRVLERIVEVKGDLEEVLVKDVDLVGEGEVKEVIFRGNDVVQATLFGEEQGKELPTVSVRLSSPLAAPREGESKATWGLRLLAKAWNDLITGVSEMPRSPYEVRRLFKDPDRQPLLSAVIEIAQVLTGSYDRAAISEGEDGVKVFRPLDSLQTLNTLAIARNIISEAAEGVRNGETGIITELNIGKVPFADVEVEGGKCDVIQVYLPKEIGTKPLPGGYSFGEIVAHVDRESGSQNLLHRRVRVNEDGREVVYRTKLPRNMATVFDRMVAHFGQEAVFDRLYVIDVDFKVPGGDGGPTTALNPDLLPEKDNNAQIDEYLWLICAQMCRVAKAGQEQKQTSLLGNSNHTLDETVISDKEVCEFILRHRLFERVKGRISYEFPGKVISKSRAIPGTEEELSKWAEAIMAPKRAIAARAADNDVLDFFALITRGRDKTIIVRPAEAVKLPERFESVCGEDYHRQYLIIDDLAQRIAEDREAGGLDLEGAVYYAEDDVYALLVRGFSSDDTLYRIAVDGGRAKFEIRAVRERKMEIRDRRDRPSGQVDRVDIELDDESYARGVLASDRQHFLLRELPEELVGRFKDRIWHMLFSEPVYVAKTRGSEMALGPDGRLIESVGGKPIYVFVDPMSGRWMFNPQALSDAVANSAEGHDFFKLRANSERINAGKGTANIFCPHPLHDNVNTPDAALSFRTGTITCFNASCGARIYLPAEMGDFERFPTKPATEVEDYFFVESARKRAINALINLTQITGRHDLSGREYLLTRGIDPDRFRWGYLPRGLSEALFNLADQKGFWSRLSEVAESRRVGNIEGKNLSELLGYVDGEDKLVATDVINSLEFLKNNEVDYQRALTILSYANLKSLRSQHVLLRNQVEGEEKGVYEERISERILMPTYWYSQTTRGLTISPSNYYGRTLVREGTALAHGPRHHKGYVGSGEWDKKEQRFVNATPAGMWLVDPGRFNQSAKLRKMVMAFEGPLSAAAGAQVMPRFADGVLAMGGTKFAVPFVAFLKGLGVPDLEVYLNTDWEGPGRAAFKEVVELIQRELPRAVVRDGREFLPDELKKILPIEGKVGDPFWPEGVTDMNDVITKTREGRRYGKFS